MRRRRIVRENLAVQPRLPGRFVPKRIGQNPHELGIVTIFPHARNCVRERAGAGSCEEKSRKCAKTAVILKKSRDGLHQNWSQGCARAALD
jgi:hypothetical protein